MTASSPLTKSVVSREAILFVVLLLVGLLLLPIAIYLVGQLIFGLYDGDGLTGFVEGIYRDILAGDGIVWFLFLSPYLGWQVIRLTAWLFRRVTTQAMTKSR